MLGLRVIGGSMPDSAALSSAQASPRSIRQSVADFVLPPLARKYFGVSGSSAGKRALWDAIFWRSRRFEVATRDGFRIRGTTDDFIQRFIYYFGVWEPHVSAVFECLKEGDVVVDVGANIGYYSLLSSRRVGSTGRVVAIEACPPIFSELSSNVELNRFENIRLVLAAAMAAEGEVEIHLEQNGNIGSTSIIAPTVGKATPFKCPGAPLSKLLSDSEIQKARLVKIDAEGAEFEVLRGAESIMPSLRDDAEFLIEVSPDRLQVMGSSASELFEFMRQFGYYGYQIQNTYSVDEYIQHSSHSNILRPRRLEAVPNDLADVLFSKRDCSSL